MHRYEYLEIAGLLLLFAAAGWEFGIEQPNDRQIASDQFRHISIRLDEIHTRQYGLQLDLNGVTEQLYFEEEPEANFVEERKQNTPYSTGNYELEGENNSYRKVSFMLFALSSLFLVGAKVSEHDHKRART